MPAKTTTDRTVKHRVVWHRSESFPLGFLTWENCDTGSDLTYQLLPYSSRFYFCGPDSLLPYGKGLSLLILLYSSKQQKHTTENHLESRLSASPIQNKKADFWCLIWSTTCSALHVSQPNWKSVTMPSFWKMEALRIRSPAGSLGSSPSFAHLLGWAAQPESFW